MRVILANKHFLGLSGGAERNISDLANYLASNGHEPIILSETKHGHDIAFPLVDGVAVLEPITERPVVDEKRLHDTVVNGTNVSIWLVESRSLRVKWGECIRRLKPDVIVTFMPHTSTFLLAEVGDEFPIIVTNQNDPAIDYFSDKHGSDPVDKFLRLEMLKRAHSVHFLIPDFVKKMPDFVSEKAIVIPNVARPNLPQDRQNNQRVIALGRLVPQKGFSLLIDAFCQTAAYEKGWELHIFGDGPEEEKLRLQIRRNMAQRQIFLRGRTAAPLQEMARSDVFVIPSEYEGWGLTLTEAMSVGLPCIGFEDCSGVNWLIQDGENGLLVPRSPSSLAGSIDRLIAEPALAKKIGDEASRSIEAFAPEKIYAMWENAIRSAGGKGN